MSDSPIEAMLMLHIRAIRLPDPVREHKFHAVRRFRFDLAWPDQLLAVECDGGTWSNGRHNRGAGYDADCEKMALALLDGWRVLRVTGTHVRSGQAVEWIARLLMGEGQ